MKDDQTMVTAKTTLEQPRLIGYVLGFIMSIALTLVAYAFVQAHVHHVEFSRTTVLLTIAGLAVVQLLVQLVFFLHLGVGQRQHWNIIMLLFAGMVVFILVGGSIWIMHNLDYNMNRAMTPTQVNQYMNSQDGL